MDDGLLRERERRVGDKGTLNFGSFVYVELVICMRKRGLLESSSKGEVWGGSRGLVHQGGKGCLWGWECGKQLGEIGMLLLAIVLL